MPPGEHIGIVMPASPTAARQLWAIVLIAVVLKALLIFGLLPYLHANFAQDYNAKLFPDGYDQIAWNIVQGNGYRLFPDSSPTMLRTPGFVLLLALLFSMFGKSLPAIQILNLMFSSATAVLIHTLARKAGISRTAALIASLIFFFHPGVVIADSRGGPESMLTLCLVASLLLAVMAVEQHTWSSFAIVGVLNGFALLVKSSVAPVLPVFFLYRVWKTPDPFVRKRILAGMAIFGIATAVVMSPWIVRNYRLSGEFVPTMTVTGLAAFQGAYLIKHLDSDREQFELLNDAAKEQIAVANAMGLRLRGSIFGRTAAGHSGYDAGESTYDPGIPFFPQFHLVEDEVSFYRELGRRAVEDYRRDPKLLFKGVVHNTLAFWTGGKTQRAMLLNAAVALPLLALAGIGLGAGLRKGPEVFQFFLIIIAFMVPHLFILAMARYYIPLVPFVAILAAIPLAKCFERFTSGWHVHRLSW